MILAAAIMAAGCTVPTAGAPAPDLEPAGPRIELGPIPTFGDVDATDEMLVFYETQDGWCTERDTGAGGCTTGTDGPPTGLSGFGVGESPDGTCMDAVAGKDVAEIVVWPGDGTTVSLRPLRGSEDTPVNVFAACWATTVSYDDFRAEAFAEDGTSLGTM